MFSNFRFARIEIQTLISSNSSSEAKKEALEAVERMIATDKVLYDKYMAIEFLPGEDALFSGFRKNLDSRMATLKSL